MEMNCAVRSQPSPYTLGREKVNTDSFPSFFLPPDWAKSQSHLYHSNPRRNSRESVPLDLHGHNQEENSSPRLCRWFISKENTKASFILTAQDGSINVKHVLHNSRIIYGIEGSQILKVFSTCNGGGQELNKEKNIY